MPMQTPQARLLTYIAIVLIGLNLRPIMAAVGPLLDSIQAQIGISDVSAGLLTTLPVLAMGVFALFGGIVQERVGVHRAISGALLLIGLASLLRWPFNSPASLIVTASIGGAGIAIVQAVLPGFIKQTRGADADRGMALFTTGIMGGATLAAVGAPLFGNAAGWPMALAVWGSLAVLAWPIWQGINVERTPPTRTTAAYRLPLGSGRAWLLVVFFSIGTAAYTLVLAWIPPFYTQLGWSSAASGLLLGGLTLAEVVSGLIVSAAIHRFPDRRRPLYLALVLVSTGLLCLIEAPHSLAWLAMTLLGLGVGGLFPLSLIVTIDHIEDAQAAGALMGFVQGGGYMLASIMPLLAGVIRQWSSSLDGAWWVMLAAIGIQGILVARLAPGLRYQAGSWELTDEAPGLSGQSIK